MRVLVSLARRRRRSSSERLVVITGLLTLGTVHVQVTTVMGSVVTPGPLSEPRSGSLKVAYKW